MRLSEITADVYDRCALFVHEKCQSFIDEFGGYPDEATALYRGMDTNWPNFVANTLAQRLPKSTNPGDQKILDDFFEKQFGHRFRSDHIVFCTGDESHAQSFGRSHIIIPIGEFKYLWDSNTHDVNIRPVHVSIHDIIRDSRYQYNTSLSYVGDNEVMINVNQYVAIPSVIYFKQILPRLQQM